MTGLLFQVLGILSTGLMYPNLNYAEQTIQPILDQIELVQQIEYEQQQQNYYEEQKAIAINDYFLFADKIGKIIYARGCAGGYEKATKGSDGKYHNCNKKAFDCGGAMKAYLIAKGLLTKASISYFNSQKLYELGQPKDPRTAEKGDFMYRRGFGEASTGTQATHFAVVSRDYDGGSTMWIYDNVVPNGTDRFHEREIPVTCNATMCHYMGRYRIYVSTNGVFELIQKTGKEILPRVDAVDTGELLMTLAPQPLLTGVATWYDYELDGVQRSKSYNTCALRIMDRYGYYKVVNVDNGKSVTCFHNDYGPKEYTNKVIDLSSHAFEQIADKSKGVINVTITKL